MRLLIVQYGGDYREAFRRITSDGVETYHAQKYVIDAIAEIGKQIEEATFFCCRTNEAYNELLQDGLRAIGAGLEPFQNSKQIIKLIQEQKPTHLVIHAPIPFLFKWAIQQRIKTIAILADSFLKKDLIIKLKDYRFARLLNHPQIDWVGNHGVNACLSVQKIGVNPEKIIPWDWCYFMTPDSFTPKEIPANKTPWNLVYIGAVLEAKGVGDILEAMAKLKSQNISVKLKIGGQGKIEYFLQRCKQLNIEHCVDFLGLIPHSQVIELMRNSDAVLVPSWHEYPEGLPLTIYEAFCSRTPLIASDHPMFRGNLKHNVNAMIFPARNFLALAECIEQLLTNPQLYNKLSQNSSNAWKQLQIPVKWADLINRWLNDSSENQHWLFEHRLTSGLYKIPDNRK
jgi:glycosyltransferase involved in cell wall biosynthesis